MVQSFLFFCSGFLWGWVADKLGRRWALIFPAIGCLIVTPLYLFTQDYAMIVVFFGLQGMFGAGGMYATNPSYLSERFPTEVRATAAGFCYHQGAIFGGLTAPIIAYFAVNWHLGFAIPMAIGTFGGCDQLHHRDVAWPGNPWQAPHRRNGGGGNLTTWDAEQRSPASHHHRSHRHRPAALRLVLGPTTMSIPWTASGSI